MELAINNLDIIESEPGFGIDRVVDGGVWVRLERISGHSFWVHTLEAFRQTVEREHRMAPEFYASQPDEPAAKFAALIGVSKTRMYCNVCRTFKPRTASGTCAFCEADGDMAMQYEVSHGG